MFVIADNGYLKISDVTISVQPKNGSYAPALYVLTWFTVNTSVSWDTSACVFILQIVAGCSILAGWAVTFIDICENKFIDISYLATCLAVIWISFFLWANLLLRQKRNDGTPNCKSVRKGNESSNHHAIDYCTNWLYPLRGEGYFKLRLTMNTRYILLAIHV